MRSGDGTSLGGSRRPEDIGNQQPFQKAYLDRAVGFRPLRQQTAGLIGTGEGWRIMAQADTLGCAFSLMIAGAILGGAEEGKQHQHPKADD